MSDSQGDQPSEERQQQEQDEDSLEQQYSGSDESGDAPGDENEDSDYENSNLTEQEANALLERLVAEVNSSPRVSDPGADASEKTKEEVKALKERGNSLFARKLFSEAVEAYSGALRLAREPEDIAVLASNRSAAFASLSQQYRSRPAARSEAAALYGLDPSHLASLALKDANKAVSLKPQWPKAYSRQGLALFLCERYLEAHEAYLQGLSLDPTSKALQEGLKEVQAIIDQASPSRDAPAGEAGADAAGPSSDNSAGNNASNAGRGAVGCRGGGGASTSAPLASPGSKRPRTLSARDCDDLECILCLKLMYEPVTTPCGHTFCKGCFARAMDHGNRCPYCRTVLHTGRDLPITVVLANIIQKSFPNEYTARKQEVLEEARLASSPGVGQYQLPLFVMSTLMPGERTGLNIFEPRYRLLVRRCMEGNRRFGMAQVRMSDRSVEDVAVEVEIIECQPQPDGRYYLEIQGKRRVQILDQSELDGYRVVKVEVVSDTPVEQGSPAAQQLQELATQVSSMADQFVNHVRAIAVGQARGARIRTLLEEAGDKPPASQVEALSFWVASLVVTFVPDQNHQRMAYLRGTDTAERLTKLKDTLASIRTEGGAGCVLM